MKLPTILCASLLLAGMANAQLVGLAGDVSPSSASIGQTITLTVTAYGGSIGLSTLGFSGLIREVRQGSPAGTPVWAPFGFTNPTSLSPGQSLTGSWNQTDDFGAQVPPGDYYLKVQTFGSPTWFHARVEGASPRPTLTALGPAQIGQPFTMSLSSPGTPNAFYVAAASFTTNVGTTLAPGQHLSLDQDALFALTFPNPDPVLFSNLQATLDASGNTAPAAPIGMFIPPVPALVDLGMMWQAVVLGPNGLEVSNTVTVTIQ